MKDKIIEFSIEIEDIETLKLLLPDTNLIKKYNSFIKIIAVFNPNTSNAEEAGKSLILAAKNGLSWVVKLLVPNTDIDSRIRAAVEAQRKGFMHIKDIIPIEEE